MSEQKYYQTYDLARECSIHPNTVRFYERIGLLSPVPRARNNYRRFDRRHMTQLKVIRLIFDGEWPGSAARAGSRHIIQALRNWDIEAAHRAAESYLELLEHEIENTLTAISILKSWSKPRPVDDGPGKTVGEISSLIGVSPEAIRNWERNGLVSLPRTGPHRKRIIYSTELDRLRIIAVLRNSGYSIAAILNALSVLSREGTDAAIDEMVSPRFLEVLSAGDHLLDVLEHAASRAKDIVALLDELS